MYTFTYQKILLHTLLLLVFKIVEYLQCILKYFPMEIFQATIAIKIGKAFSGGGECFGRVGDGKTAPCKTVPGKLPPYNYLLDNSILTKKAPS